jgi:hypothetical protein
LKSWVSMSTRQHKMFPFRDSDFIWLMARVPKISCLKLTKRWMRWLASIPWTNTRHTKIWWNTRGR